MNCSNQKNLQKPPLGGLVVFDKQGHRGCRGLMPENTIPAMIHALDWGVTTLEMDVVITKDKKVILSHEPWFSHEITTRPDGSYIGEREERKFNIYWMTYEETKAFDVGMKPHPRFPRQQKIKAVKPLLADVIDSVKNEMMTRKRPPVYYNIETKSNPEGDGVFHPKPDEFVELLMAVIQEKGIQDYVIIQSFDFRTLQYLHDKYPDIKTGMLIKGFDKKTLDEQLKKLGFTAINYSPHYSMVTEELVKLCHAKGMKLIPWTVNDKAKMDELKKMGVDGIITDYPDLFD
ncbi:MAG: glycerophosphodiester phosphodiesterase [Bacteroidetes bacterium]|nr:glycerophosphodiester phosphodiesterase [Bacteroidota bacterium]